MSDSNSLGQLRKAVREDRVGATSSWGLIRLPLETNIQGSTSSSKDKEKELRRIYRKLKGVRSQLSVKIRKLKKEISEAEYEAEDDEDNIPDEALEIAPQEHESDEDFGEARKHGRASKALDSTQYEVKSLIDHKRRLREKFWKLQEEARRKR